MRIGEVAKQAGIATSQIRYYERIGLLPIADRVSGQRRYGSEVLRRLSVIDVAQRAGMTLDEIKVLIEHGNAPVSEVMSELAEQKLPQIDALIERAQRVRAWLAAAQTCDCQTLDACALFTDAPTAAPIRILGPAAADRLLDVGPPAGTSRRERQSR